MTAVLLANAIAADAGLIPGLAIFGPALGLPLSVLAAFIERPFMTRAGVGRNAIWFSLQANLVSLLFGYFATMVVVPFIMSPGGPVVALAWSFAAVGISVVTVTSTSIVPADASPARKLYALLMPPIRSDRPAACDRTPAVGRLLTCPPQQRKLSANRGLCGPRPISPGIPAIHGLGAAGPRAILAPPASASRLS